jgi:hypothetical protein
VSQTLESRKGYCANKKASFGTLENEIYLMDVMRIWEREREK